MVKDQSIFFRDYSDPITDRVGTEQVMGIYAKQPSARLHKHERQAKILSWSMTGHYNQHQDHQSEITVKLPEPTADPIGVTKAAKRLPPALGRRDVHQGGRGRHGSSPLGDAGIFRSISVRA